MCLLFRCGKRNETTHSNYAFDMIMDLFHPNDGSVTNHRRFETNTLGHIAILYCHTFLIFESQRKTPQNWLKINASLTKKTHKKKQNKTK